MQSRCHAVWLPTPAKEPAQNDSYYTYLLHRVSNMRFSYSWEIKNQSQNTAYIPSNISSRDWLMAFTSSGHTKRSYSKNNLLLALALCVLPDQCIWAQCHTIPLFHNVIEAFPCTISACALFSSYNTRFLAGLMSVSEPNQPHLVPFCSSSASLSKESNNQGDKDLKTYKRVYLHLSSQNLHLLSRRPTKAVHPPQISCSEILHCTQKVYM